MFRKIKTADQLNIELFTRCMNMIIAREGKKSKFLSFVRFMPDLTWTAGKEKPGVANGYDLKLVAKTIKEQKKTQTISLHTCTGE
ncbi:hypothetical protein JDS69_29475 [Bacillus cereus]|nr:hypothetical protein IIS_04797 [Bacillus cereus VD131]MBJ8044418.1 hypothetical protein [Bacillus cereus group sp. N17]MBJ8067866.1 hypothetical protein [Bacillus cereus group sp. N15]MBJ8119674.1 hypothetical protein [Bacillus cereus]MCS3600388.1 hypothetical protein [Bacillus sp. JUb91]OFC90945.1 hypothetical protein BTGOE5_56670 [Bacillus thuringiensis]TBX53741.1 hypothetical protein E0M28_31175 [Bacillus toyonensis]